MVNDIEVTFSEKIEKLRKNKRMVSNWSTLMHGIHRTEKDGGCTFYYNTLRT